jgi:D-alanyl-D-alanine carboxypeptidase
MPLMPMGLLHPASLTKTMMLYLLFERLESGAIKLYAVDTVCTRRGTAARQTRDQTWAIHPSRPGHQSRRHQVQPTIVAIAENLAGDEKEFAKL